MNNVSGPVSGPKKLLFVLIFIVMSSLMLIFIGEGTLRILANVTSRGIFQLPQRTGNDYPKDPANTLKIAVYGGSAGSGYLSERKLSDVLKADLEQHYPGKKFYIKNFATPGHPFHKVQAEFLKEDIDNFDIFVTYTGTNEGQIYIDDSGYFRKPEYKAAQFKKFGDEKSNLKLRHVDDVTGFMAFLKYSSRLYNVSSVLVNRFKPKGKEQQLYNFWNFKEFSNDIIFPENEVENIYRNFENDLTQIAELISKKDKRLIMMAEITDQFWKPGFSIFSTKTTDEQKIQIQKLYNEATMFYEAKKYKESISKIKAALAIDHEPAILHHYLGLNYYYSGKKAEAKLELAESVAKDPWHAKANKLHYAIQEKLSKADPLHLSYVDPSEDFYRLYDLGLASPEIFSDFMHPNFLGHIVLGKNLLCRVRELIEAKKNICDDFLKNPRDLLRAYQEKLNVTPFDQSENYFLSARFNIGMSDYVTAYPKDILDLGKYFLQKFYEYSDKSDLNAIRFSVFKALELSKSGKVEEAIAILNQALDKYQKQVTNFLNEALNNGLYINEAFSNRGIILNQAINKFEKAKS